MADPEYRSGNNQHNQYYCGNSVYRVVFHCHDLLIMRYFFYNYHSKVAERRNRDNFLQEE